MSLGQVSTQSYVIQLDMDAKNTLDAIDKVKKKMEELADSKFDGQSTFGDSKKATRDLTNGISGVSDALSKVGVEFHKKMNHALQTADKALQKQLQILEAKKEELKLVKQIEAEKAKAKVIQPTNADTSLTEYQDKVLNRKLDSLISQRTEEAKKKFKELGDKMSQGISKPWENLSDAIDKTSAVFKKTYLADLEQANKELDRLIKQQRAVASATNATPIDDNLAKRLNAQIESKGKEASRLFNELEKKGNQSISSMRMEWKNFVDGINSTDAVFKRGMLVDLDVALIKLRDLTKEQRRMEQEANAQQVLADKKQREAQIEAERQSKRLLMEGKISDEIAKQLAILEQLGASNRKLEDVSNTISPALGNGNIEELKNALKLVKEEVGLQKKAEAESLKAIKREEAERVKLAKIQERELSRLEKEQLIHKKMDHNLRSKATQAESLSNKLGDSANGISRVWDRVGEGLDRMSLSVKRGLVTDLDIVLSQLKEISNVSSNQGKELIQSKELDVRINVKAGEAERLFRSLGDKAQGMETPWVRLQQIVGTDVPSAMKKGYLSELNNAVVQMKSLEQAGREEAKQRLADLKLQEVAEKKNRAEKERLERERLTGSKLDTEILKYGKQYRALYQELGASTKELNELWKDVQRNIGEGVANSAKRDAIEELKRSILDMQEAKRELEKERKQQSEDHKRKLTTQGLKTEKDALDKQFSQMSKALGDKSKAVKKPQIDLTQDVIQGYNDYILRIKEAIKQLKELEKAERELARQDRMGKKTDAIIETKVNEVKKLFADLGTSASGVSKPWENLKTSLQDMSIEMKRGYLTDLEVARIRLSEISREQKEIQKNQAQANKESLTNKKIDNQILSRLTEMQMLYDRLNEAGKAKAQPLFDTSTPLNQMSLDNKKEYLDNLGRAKKEIAEILKLQAEVERQQKGSGEAQEKKLNYMISKKRTDLERLYTHLGSQANHITKPWEQLQVSVDDMSQSMKKGYIADLDIAYQKMQDLIRLQRESEKAEERKVNEDSFHKKMNTKIERGTKEVQKLFAVLGDSADHILKPWDALTQSVDSMSASMKKGYLVDLEIAKQKLQDIAREKKEIEKATNQQEQGALFNKRIDNHISLSVEELKKKFDLMGSKANHIVKPWEQVNQSLNQMSMNMKKNYLVDLEHAHKQLNLILRTQNEISRAEDKKYKDEVDRIRLQEEIKKRIDEVAQAKDRAGKKAQGMVMPWERMAKPLDQMSNKMMKSFLSDLDHTYKNLRIINGELDKTGRNVGALTRGFGGLGKKAYGFAKWMILIKGFYALQRSIRDTFKSMLEFELGLIRLDKVMDATEREIMGLGQASFELGQMIGKSANEVLQVMEIFAKQGREAMEVQELTRVALLASNVAQIQSAEAAKYLTAATLQFKIASEESIKVLDAWNNVANNNAVSAEDLAQAISQTGTAARLAGVDIHMLNGIVTAMVAATAKSGTEIGNFLKFMFQRVGRPEIVASIQEVGIQMYTVEGQFRDFAEIIQEVGEKWESFSDKSRMNIARAFGGRRMNEVQSMFENWDNAVKATNDSLNSHGSALRENAKYLESTSAKVQIMRTKWEELGVALGATGLLSVYKTVIEMTGSLAENLKSALDATVAWQKAWFGDTIMNHVDEWLRGVAGLEEANEQLLYRLYDNVQATELQISSLRELNKKYLGTISAVDGVIKSLEELNEEQKAELELELELSIEDFQQKIAESERVIKNILTGIQFSGRELDSDEVQILVDILNDAEANLIRFRAEMSGLEDQLKAIRSQEVHSITSGMPTVEINALAGRLALLKEELEDVTISWDSFFLKLDELTSIRSQIAETEIGVLKTRINEVGNLLGTINDAGGEWWELIKEGVENEEKLNEIYESRAGLLEKAFYHGYIGMDRYMSEMQALRDDDTFRRKREEILEMNRALEEGTKSALQDAFSGFLMGEEDAFSSLTSNIKSMYADVFAGQMASFVTESDFFKNQQEQFAKGFASLFGLDIGQQLEGHDLTNYLMKESNELSQESNDINTEIADKIDTLIDIAEAQQAVDKVLSGQKEDPKIDTAILGAKMSTKNFMALLHEPEEFAEAILDWTLETSIQIYNWFGSVKDSVLGWLNERKWWVDFTDFLKLPPVEMYQVVSEWASETVKGIQDWIVGFNLGIVNWLNKHQVSTNLEDWWEGIPVEKDGFTSGLEEEKVGFKDKLKLTPMVIGESLQELWRSIGVQLESGINWIQGKIDEIKQFIETKFIAPIKEWWNGIPLEEEGILSGLDEEKTGFKHALEEFRQSITDGFSGAWEGFVDGLKERIGYNEGMFANLRRSYHQNIVTPVLDWWVGIPVEESEFTSGLDYGQRGFKDTLANLYNPIVARVKEAWGGFVEKLKAHTEGYDFSFAGLSKSFQDNVIQPIADWWNRAVERDKELHGEVDYGQEEFADTLKRLSRTLWYGLEDAWNGFVESLKGWTEGISTNFDNTCRSFQDSIITPIEIWWNGIPVEDNSGGLNYGQGGFNATLRRLPSVIRDSTQEAWNEFVRRLGVRVEFYREEFDSLKRGFNENIVEPINVWWNGVPNEEGIANYGQEGFRQTLESLITPIRDGISSAWNVFIEHLRNRVEYYTENFAGIKKNFEENIIKPIQEWWNGVPITHESDDIDGEKIISGLDKSILGFKDKLKEFHETLYDSSIHYQILFDSITIAWDVTQKGIQQATEMMQRNVSSINEWWHGTSLDRGFAPELTRQEGYKFQVIGFIKQLDGLSPTQQIAFLYESLFSYTSNALRNWWTSLYDWWNGIPLDENFGGEERISSGLEWKQIGFKDQMPNRFAELKESVSLLPYTIFDHLVNFTEKIKDSINNAFNNDQEFALDIGGIGESFNSAINKAVEIIGEDNATKLESLSEKWVQAFAQSAQGQTIRTTQEVYLEYKAGEVSLSDAIGKAFESVVNIPMGVFALSLFAPGKLRLTLMLASLVFSLAPQNIQEGVRDLFQQIGQHLQLAWNNLWGIETPELEIQPTIDINPVRKFGGQEKELKLEDYQSGFQLDLDISDQIQKAIADNTIEIETRTSLSDTTRSVLDSISEEISRLKVELTDSDVARDWGEQAGEMFFDMLVIASKGIWDGAKWISEEIGPILVDALDLVIVTAYDILGGFIVGFANRFVDSIREPFDMILDYFEHHSLWDVLWGRRNPDFPTSVEDWRYWREHGVLPTPVMSEAERADAVADLDRQVSDRVGGVVVMSAPEWQLVNRSADEPLQFPGVPELEDYRIVPRGEKGEVPNYATDLINDLYEQTDIDSLGVLVSSGFSDFLQMMGTRFESIFDAWSSYIAIQDVTNSISSSIVPFGFLASTFESGGNSSVIGHDVAGGDSFGKYQIATRTGTMGNFVEWLRKEVERDSGEEYKLAHELLSGANTGELREAWINLVGRLGESFELIQDEFIKQTHYIPALGNIGRHYGSDFANRINEDVALREYVLSLSVQHGGDTNLFKNAGLSTDMTSQEIIEALTRERARVLEDGSLAYFTSFRTGDPIIESLLNRFQKEMFAAFELLPNDERINALVDETGEFAIHLVKTGENLSKIAEMYGTTVAELSRINEITDPNRIRTNQLLKIPRVVGAGGSSQTNRSFAEGGFTPSGNKFEEVGTVHAGEWVAPQWMVDKYKSFFVNLEVVRKRGYAEGGFVGGGFSLTGRNNSIGNSINRVLDEMNSSVSYIKGELVYRDMLLSLRNIEKSAEEQKETQETQTDRLRSWLEYGKGENAQKIRDIISAGMSGYSQTGSLLSSIGYALSATQPADSSSRFGMQGISDLIGGLTMMRNEDSRRDGWSSFGSGAGGLLGLLFSGGSPIGASIGSSIGQFLGGILGDVFGGRESATEPESMPWQRVIVTPEFFPMDERFYMSGRHMQDLRQKDREVVEQENITFSQGAIQINVTSAKNPQETAREVARQFNRELSRGLAR